MCLCWGDKIRSVWREDENNSGFAWLCGLLAQTAEPLALSWSIKALANGSTQDLGLWWVWVPAMFPKFESGSLNMSFYNFPTPRICPCPARWTCHSCIFSRSCGVFLRAFRTRIYLQLSIIKEDNVGYVNVHGCVTVLRLWNYEEIQRNGQLLRMNSCLSFISRGCIVWAFPPFFPFFAAAVAYFCNSVCQPCHSSAWIGRVAAAAAWSDL